LMMAWLNLAHGLQSIQIGQYNNNIELKIKKTLHNGGFFIL